MFRTYRNGVDSHSLMNGYSNNKCLNIDTFIDRLKVESNSSAFKHLQKNSNGRMNLQNDEECRVYRKVLHAANKLRDPGKAFEGTVNHHGWCSDNQFKEALNLMGANLSNSEYTTLLNGCRSNLDSALKSSQQNINMIEFSDKINKFVRQADAERKSSREALLQDTSKSPIGRHRYSASYDSKQTNAALFDHEEYDNMNHTSKSFKKEQNQWRKLRNNLQNSESLVLSIFTDKRDAFKSSKQNIRADMNELVEVDRNNLKTMIRKSGIQLGDDDLNRLQKHLENNMTSTDKGTCDENSNKISLASFCGTVGIPIREVGQNKDKIELSYRSAEELDGGVFASSRVSQLSNPTLSTTVYNQSTEECSKWIGGEKRR